MESKSFEISVEEVGVKLKGVIVEKSRGLSAWIRFGDLSLWCLLEGEEACCRDEGLERWSKGWEEGGGGFSWIVREWGWEFFMLFCCGERREAVSLNLSQREGSSCGVGCFSGEVAILRWVICDALTKDLGVVRDAAWLQLKENEAHGREEYFRQSLVKEGMKIFAFGGAQCCLSLRTSKAEKVFARGSRRIKENLLQLVRWTTEEEDRILFGGFIAVDEGTACMANLQWTRILVKSVRRVLPEELHLVIGSTSFSFQLWWEVSPCYSLVVQRSCSSELGVLENKDDGGRRPKALIALDLAQAESEEEGEAFLSVGRAHVLLSRYKGEALREGCLCRVSDGVYGLWNGSWCVAGDFNVILNPEERNRFLINEEWDCQFSGSRQCVLPRQLSDHFPILLEGGGVRRGPSPFRFENIWLKVEEFKDLLKAWWEGETFMGGLQEEFGLGAAAILDEKEKTNRLSLEEMDVRREAREDFKKWVLLEEVLGDKNLGRINGVWNSKENGISEGIVNAFRSLLSNLGDWRPPLSRLQCETLQNVDAAALEVSFTEEEVYGALVGCSGDKAPRLDGFTMAFC
ncbi:hypothetical protein CK203_103008 [Vitis vinifera]|uniref:DUF4283 domain-containing protein n=1 Tax=Vitis vinifera TaxID=29760 RepID=A0A438CIX3_VITVI|nr:hypothetical protein CK203_103008 [Vitis vinifera]